MWGSKREWTDCEVYGERRSPGRDDQGFAAFGSSDEHVAEGVGFEPTVTCATMVFETIRFGRSRIPPGGMLRAGARRFAKTSVSIAAHSSARIPVTISVVWFSRGSAAKLYNVPA